MLGRDGRGSKSDLERRAPEVAAALAGFVETAERLIVGLVHPDSLQMEATGESGIRSMRDLRRLKLWGKVKRVGWRESRGKELKQCTTTQKRMKKKRKNDGTRDTGEGKGEARSCGGAWRSFGRETEAGGPE